MSQINQINQIFFNPKGKTVSDIYGYRVGINLFYLTNLVLSNHTKIVFRIFNGALNHD